MQRFRTLETVGLGPGARVELTKEQSASRLGLGALAPASKKKSETVFTVVKPVQFKAGEVLGIDTEMPRALADRLEAVDAAGDPVAVGPDDGAAGDRQLALGDDGDAGPSDDGGGDTDDGGEGAS